MAPLDDEVFNAVYVEGDDGFLAFVRFQEGQGELAVHEAVLGEDCGGVCVLEEVEGGLEVGITIGEVGPDLVAGKMLPGGFVEAVGQFIGEAVTVVGVAAPAGGVVPFLAVAGGIHVDAHDDGFLHGVANLAGEVVGPAFTVVLVLPEASVGRVFARGGTVTLLISRSRSSTSLGRALNFSFQ